MKFFESLKYELSIEVNPLVQFPLVLSIIALTLILLHLIMSYCAAVIPILVFFVPICYISYVGFFKHRKIND